ncbi:undecaprenyl-diphosphatase [Hymenobacter luteus]|uniref:Undecaprenyl-diphosphatase n=2 Tax=Hymenobacter TaxID=89966 RepID=A0A7W9T416_9BACT|nr:phosphatase PAP2 family protein [Hymenobacter latericoloratus]MBB4603430.1 undecaprenyl-diphosphatase [Hymenobacter latericoloratus]MBB6061216.1 undecaprenyl-diphosphatase [Hymenobacter luteus]
MLTTLFDILRQADHGLLLALNGLHTPWLDSVMVFASQAKSWLSGYLLLIVGLAYLFRRRAWALLPIIGASVGLADLISARLFKPFFHRLRPSHTPDLGPLLHLPDGPGGPLGFPSSHAANVTALATLLCLLLPPRYRAAKGCAVAWATLVCLSRVYLGVHYPADVLGGALLGVALGFGGAAVYGWVGRRLARPVPAPTHALQQV